MGCALAERRWATEQFKGVRGDARLVRRLVAMAGQAARRPAGMVTQVFRASAEREAAFRLLENARLCADEVARATHDAVADQCRGQEVYVPLDGSSLSLTERTASRELGGVGAWKDFGRGLLVASAFAVSAAGVPVGICGQRFWSREAPTTKRVKNHRAMQTETRHGVELLEQVHARLQASGAQPWYQLDRGFDVWPILQRACREKMRLTVRAVGSRRVLDSLGRRKLLRDLAGRAPLLGHYELQVRATATRPPRTARMRLRCATVTVPLAVGKRRREHVRLQLVHAQEISADPQRLVWMLLTTVPVDGLQDALRVVRGYTMRWRIEDFHRAWKQGLCRVEDSQLRSREALTKWATLLSAVAARATRLAHLARQIDDSAPATDEFSPDEINAIVALREPKGVRRGVTPSLHQAIRWVADLGGYTGKSSGGPPGATVIGRGLADVEVLVRGLNNLRRMESG
jgi:DDE family transposase/transposase-like protein